MLSWLTAGESHGPALVAVLDGMPAGVEVTTADIEHALARRRAGYGRGARMKFEQDECRIIGGVRHGLTMGSPIAIEIANTEWPKWEAVMSPDPVAASSLDHDAGKGDPLEVARNKPLTRPRPGHADLAAMQKYGFDDARPALERASARETAARVALGAVAAKLLSQVVGIELVSHVTAIGSVNVNDYSSCLDSATVAPHAGDLAQNDGELVAPPPPETKGLSASSSFCGKEPEARKIAESPKSIASIPAVEPVETKGIPTPAHRAYLETDPVRCLNPQASAAMVAEIDAAKKGGDTLGGVVEVLAYHVPVGLGSYSQGATRLDAQLASALMGIQAVKAVEIGDGVAVAVARGSMAHDEIVRIADGAVARLTNHAGGIEGGMSNGELIRVKAYLKPISSVPRALRTVDVATGEPATAHHQRSDVCAVVPAAVVAEAEVALVLARAILEKFGGDSVTETRRNLQTYLASLPSV